MKTPLDTMLDGVEWQELEKPPPGADEVPQELPVATHCGVLDLMGTKLRCYRLSDGRAIFDADDVNKFFTTSVSA